MRVAPALVLACVATAAQAQQPAPAITLKLSLEQTQMLVETLGAVPCGNVRQLMLCERAKEILLEIQRQAREQIK